MNTKEALNAQTVVISDEFIDVLILAICEMPDRNSPEDFPEGMVVTPEELRQYIRCIEERFAECGESILASPAPDVRPSVLSDALSNALERMDRARSILTNGQPTSACKWGMLDTADLRAVLSTQPVSAPVSDEPNTIKSLEAASGSMTDFAEAADLIHKIMVAETNGGALGIILGYRQKVRMEALASQQVGHPKVEQIDAERTRTTYKLCTCSGTQAVPAAPAGWSAAATWLRNNYQDYPTIDALTVAMIAAAQAAPSVSDAIAARLQKIESLAQQGMCHGLLADDYCRQIAAIAAQSKEGGAA